MELFVLPILLLLGVGFLFFNDNDDSSDSGTAGADGDGNEPLPVTPLVNVLEFTEDDDTALGADSNDLIRTFGGDDTILAGEGDDNVFAGDGDDTVIGEAGDDRIFLGEGDDVVLNTPPADLAVTPSGQAAEGDDFIRGGGGNDTISDNLGSNTLYGDLGADTLDARDSEFDGGTPDTLFGGFGNDILRGDAGDTLTGGGNKDVFDVTSNGTAAPAVITDFAAGENLIVRGDDDQPVDMDRLTTALADNGEDLNVLLDDEIVAVLQGLTTLPAGAFTMMANGTAGASGSANDAPPIENGLFGTDGNDTLVGDDGQDGIFGGAGDDVISLARPAISSPDDQDVRINAGIGNDIATGGGGDDVIFGNLGRDILAGNEGTDTLFGGFGNDLLISDDPLTDSPDVVDGGGGDDVLVADDGDVLTGGKGVDGFVNVLRDVTHDPIVVTDFDPAREALEVIIPASTAVPPVLTAANNAAGTATEISLGNTVVFVLQGVQAADVNVGGIILTQSTTI